MVYMVYNLMSVHSSNDQFVTQISGFSHLILLGRSVLLHCSLMSEEVGHHKPNLGADQLKLAGSFVIAHIS